MHWPAAANQFDDWEAINRDTWRAMTELYQAGKIRAIGVSNFRPHHLKALLETEVAPMVNQIEFHPGCQQRETLAFCRDHGILVEAWSPLGRGRVLDHPTLTAIAQNHGKTPAQICLRWCLEQGVLPLPKSVTPARMAENRDLFTFALTPGDMAQIAALPPFGGSGHDPDQLDF
ncbi:MAG: aldo/keto reductase [Evtepia sp.]